jgi:hypothetical protein
LLNLSGWIFLGAGLGGVLRFLCSNMVARALPEPTRLQGTSPGSPQCKIRIPEMQHSWSSAVEDFAKIIRF